LLSTAFSQVLPPRCAGLYGLKPTSGLVSNSRILNLRSVVIWYSPLVSNDITSAVTIAYRTTTAKPRFRQLSPRVAHHRTPKNGNARSFGLIAIRTPKIAEIHLLRHCRDRDVMFGRRDMEHKVSRSHIEQRRQNHVFAISPRVAHPRTPKNGNARSFGLLAFRTPRLPRFTFCATAEIET